MGHQSPNEGDPELESLISSFGKKGEEWDSLSDTEQDERVASANYAMLEFLGAGCLVTFADEVTPVSDGGDPHRLCSIVGTVIKFGKNEEKKQPWALIDIAQHLLQLTSTHEAQEGFKEMYNQTFSDLADIHEAWEVFAKFEESHPETATYIELPIEENPKVFLLKDLIGCVFSPPDVFDI
jgi:hypothetical protein